MLPVILKQANGVIQNSFELVTMACTKLTARRTNTEPDGEPPRQATELLWRCPIHPGQSDLLFNKNFLLLELVTVEPSLSFAGPYKGTILTKNTTDNHIENGFLKSYLCFSIYIFLNLIV